MNLFDKESKSIFFGGGGGGARISDSFTKNPHLNKKEFFGGRWGWGGGGARVSKIYFTKNPNQKQFRCGGWGGVGLQYVNFFTNNPNQWRLG